jgi:multidrug efflux system membrane fusion protein
MQEENIRQSPDPHIGPDHQLPPPHEEHRRSGIGRAIVWIALLAAFGLLFYFVLRHKEAATAAGGRHAMGGAVTATVVTAKKGDIGVYLDAIGTVTPVYTDSLTSQVTGLITAVNYREGQTVRKGQPLIQIDSRPYRANLMTAEGTLERDQNILAQAKMDLARYQAAWARNAIPKQTLDDQEKIVLQDEGTVKTDEGTVAYDKVQVSFCNIFAPVSGRVGLRLVDPGNVVTSGSSTVLAVITQMEPMTIIFTIAEDSLADVNAQLRLGRKLTVDAYDRAMQKKITSGTLSTVDNQIDTATGTVKMRASFANKDDLLFPNEFVNTRLLVRTIKDATLIPNSAIQRNGDQAFVYLVQNGKAKITNVAPGTVDGLTTAVTGIQPGDVIADSSFEKLQDGSEIHVSAAKIPKSGNSAESNAP